MHDGILQDQTDLLNQIGANSEWYLVFSLVGGLRQSVLSKVLVFD